MMITPARLLGLAAALAAAAPAAAAERAYSVADFDRVQVDGPYDVVLATGGPSGVRATGSQLAIDGVTIEVSGGLLRVHANHAAWGGYPGASAGSVKIYAITRELRSAAVRGSGSLAIDRARGLRVDLNVTGSGRLSVAALDADQLNLGLLGAGRLTLAGAAKQMRATIQGTGDLDAARLKVDDAQLTTDTAGSVAFQARRSAKVKALGSGAVDVAGTADCTVEASGGGSVRCGRKR
jgi:hypothetical protein